MELVKKNINERGFYLEKILALVDELFEGNKAKFLRETGLSNSYIDSMRKRFEDEKNPIPGADALNNMIDAARKKNPDFNPLWLIRDDERMFEPRRNTELPEAADPTVNYLSSTLEELEKGGDLRSSELPKDFPLQVAKLLVKLLEPGHAG